MATASPSHPTSWGYAGVFPGAFRVWDGDQLLNKIRFAADHGFSGTGVGLHDVAEPERLDAVANLVRTHDLALSTHISAPFFTASPEELTATAQTLIARLEAVREPMNLSLVIVNAGPYHRFQREPSLAFQLERLAHTLRPIAAWCAERGLPLGIENHVDYWIEDLVELCGRVPGLGIFFDTANTILLGERPVDAAKLAAPLAVGTHFKEVTIEPIERGLQCVNRGAAFGEGDVELARVYAELIAGSPNPAALRMEFEFIPTCDEESWAELERSKRFVERLAGVSFRYPSKP